MTAAELAITIQSSVALAILLALFLLSAPALRLDIFRQKMFSLRDELFDYASSGKIHFDHPAHRLLRQSMNGFIRYGHRLTFFQLCVTFCRWHCLAEKPATEWTRRWEAALGSIEDEQVKKDLEAFHSRSMSLVINRLISGSPVLLATMLVTLSVLLTGLLFRGAWRSMAELYSLAATQTFKTFSIDPSALEDEALRSSFAR